jgi:hypothetical protein
MDYVSVISIHMLSFPMFVPHQPLRKIGSYPAIIQASAKRSELTFFVCYCCKLFCHLTGFISFNFNNFQTLFAKHLGWGVPVP